MTRKLFAAGITTAIIIVSGCKTAQTLPPTWQHKTVVISTLDNRQYLGQEAFLGRLVNGKGQSDSPRWQFRVVKGLAEANAVSFISYNYSSRFIVANPKGELWIEENPDKQHATFRMIEATP